MTDSNETPLRLPVREMRGEPAPQRAASVIQQAIEALERIYRWDELSADFRTNYGSNGERDHYRRVASLALASLRAAQEGDLPPLPEPKAWMDDEGRVVSFNLVKRYPEHRIGYNTPLYTADQLRTAIAAAGGGVGVVQAFDVAVSDELPRVSHVHYDSHEICKHFAGEVRKRLLASSPQPEAAPAVAQVPNWRDHVEQRIRTWRQRTMNKSGDRLAIDDFMEQDSIDDLVDFVCDEWSEPKAAAPEAPAQAEATDWILAMGHALGVDSGYFIPIVPSVDEFKRLFAEVRRRAVAEQQAQAAPSAGEVEREALIERGRKLADTLETWYGPKGHALTVRQLVAALSHKEQP